MIPRVVLFGRELELDASTETWRGQVGPVVLRVRQIRREEPLRWIAYAMAEPRAELASGSGGTIETAIALCEEDGRGRLEALLALRGEGWTDLASEAELPKGFSVREERVGEALRWALYDEGNRLGYYPTRERAVEVAHAWPRLEAVRMDTPDMDDVEDGHPLDMIDASLREPCS